MSDQYQRVKEKFSEGDWIFGIGKHVGCSPVFDHDTNNPQPFSYLDETNPDEFRLATIQEISDATRIPVEQVEMELEIGETDLY